MWYRHALLSLPFFVSAVLLHADSNRTSALAGTIRTQPNSAIYAEVTAYRLDVRNGNIRPHYECSTHVDGEGAFRCEHLPSGSYVLVFTFPQVPPPETHEPPQLSTTPAKFLPPAAFAASIVKQPRPFGPLFSSYPASGELQPSNLIHLAPGQTQSLDIAIDPGAMSTLKAKPALGSATGQVQVFAEGEDFSIPLNIQASVDVSDGNYLWQGVSPGTYKVAENWTTGDESHEAVRTVVVAPGTTKTISMAGDAFYQLRGTLTGSGPADSTASEVILDGVTGEQKRHYSASVDKDRTFTFKDIEEGFYRVSLAIGNQAYVSELMVGGRPASNDTISVSEGISQQRLTIVTKKATVSVAGILKLDGSEPKPGIVIQSAESHSAMLVRVQPNGTFSFTGLAPGQYRIYGWSDISAVPYNSAAFLSRYSDHATALQLQEGAAAPTLEIECNKSDL